MTVDYTECTFINRARSKSELDIIQNISCIHSYNYVYYKYVDRKLILSVKNLDTKRSDIKVTVKKFLTIHSSEVLYLFNCMCNQHEQKY